MIRTEEGARAATGFAQHDANLAKLGAYYTDQEHCRLIATWLQMPEEKCYVLEPSMGDGEAVITITGQRNGRDDCILGCEIDTEVAESTSKKPEICKVLKEDFTTGIKATNGSFGLLVSNPPYGESPELTYGGKHKRWEVEFLVDATKYLARDGVAVWIVPRTVFGNYEHMATILKNYDILKRFRFLDGEYDKFHQVVLIMRKHMMKPKSAKEVKAFMEEFLNPDEFELLRACTDGDEKIEVPTGTKPKDFKTINFDPRTCLEQLEKDGREKGQWLVPEEYSGTRIVHPVLPLNVASKSLMMVNGIGQGLCGSTEDGTLHLQRGSTKIIEELTEVKEREKDVVGTYKRHVTAYITRIEWDGTISRIE